MSDDIYSYQPSQGHGLPHDPFNAIVGPRPIGWISSQDANGKLDRKSTRLNSSHWE